MFRSKNGCAGFCSSSVLSFGCLCCRDVCFRWMIFWKRIEGGAPRVRRSSQKARKFERAFNVARPIWPKAVRAAALLKSPLLKNFPSLAAWNGGWYLRSFYAACCACASRCAKAEFFNEAASFFRGYSTLWLLRSRRPISMSSGGRGFHPMPASNGKIPMVSTMAELYTNSARVSRLS